MSPFPEPDLRLKLLSPLMVSKRGHSAFPSAYKRQPCLKSTTRNTVLPQSTREKQNVPFSRLFPKKRGLSFNLGRLGTVPILKQPKMGTVPNGTAVPV